MPAKTQRKRKPRPSGLKASPGHRVPRKDCARGGRATAAQMAARRIEVMRRLKGGEWPACVPELAKAWGIHPKTVTAYRGQAIDMLRAGLKMRVENGWGLTQAAEVAAELCGDDQDLAAELQEQVLLAAYSTLGIGGWRPEALMASIFLRLRRAEDAAIANGQPSAAISAIKVEAELLGFYDAPPAHDDGRRVDDVPNMVDEIVSTETP